ncbi:MAG TPA: SGNH/GDSL hydrolase family protein [Candidatus Polarisedimenticolia bacterium]|jgi:lysophospholipase L1-like esterase|nr:SGNH/GDSL hydrolase family protein [Candidatus Polarisedimenticolia bacterium]
MPPSRAGEAGASPSPAARWTGPLILVASTLLALVLAEASLHLLGLPEEHRSHTHPPQFDPIPGADFLYTNLPASEIRFVYDSNPRGYFSPGNAVIHRTNPKGFRGPDFSVAKPPGTIRFLFLGDSFTFGEGVQDADTYPERFRALLEKTEAYRGMSIEAINLGVGGYDTEQEAALLRDFGLSLTPDWVFVGYCLNDAEPPLFERGPDGKLVRRDREAEAPENLGTAPIPAPWRWLRLTRLAYLAYRNQRSTAATIAHYRDLYRDDGADYRRTKRALAEIARLGRGAGVPVTVLIFPVFYHLDAGYPFRDLTRQIEAEAGRNQIDAIDLLPWFRGFSGPDLWVHPADQHPNETAHRIVAERLVEYVAAEGVTPPKPPR